MLTRVTELAARGDGLALKAALADHPGGGSDARRINRLPARLRVRLVRCRECGSGHIQPAMVTGQGRGIRVKALEKMPLSPDATRVLAGEQAGLPRAAPTTEGDSRAFPSPATTVGSSVAIPSTTNCTAVAARIRPITRWRTFMPVWPRRRSTRRPLRSRPSVTSDVSAIAPKTTMYCQTCWARETSTITVDVAPGPASMGIASGKIETSGRSSALGFLLGRRALARALRAQHVDRQQEEQHAAGDAERAQRDAEHAEDHAAERAERGQHEAGGQRRAERRAPLVLERCRIPSSTRSSGTAAGASTTSSRVVSVEKVKERTPVNTGESCHAAS